MLAIALSALLIADSPPLLREGRHHPPGAPASRACDCGCGCPACGPTRAVGTPPSAAAPSPPTSWDLADATGQHWRHADRAVLESWVAARNASLRPATATYPAATYYFAAPARRACSTCR